MSGDVQPRKRKDKKRKKDELSAGAEELHAPAPGARGTAAIFGESDVFLHTHHDHGIGGHWCAKVIFFSLLAVLITLIGLIILENRGLSELEANSVESRYASVLEGWLEDAPDDDHHDEHTLELKHHEEKEESEEMQMAYRNGDHEDEEHDDDDDDDEKEPDLDDGDYEDQDEEDSEDNENDLEDENDASEEEEDLKYHKYVDDEDENNEDQNEDQEDESIEQGNKKEWRYDGQDEGDDDNDIDQRYDEVKESYSYNQVDEQEDNDDEPYNSDERENNQDDNDSRENVGQANEDEEHDDEDDHDEDEDTEVEHIEQEPDEEPINVELPALHQPGDDDDDHDDQRKGADEDDDADDADQDDNDDFLDQDEIDNEPPVVERFSAPAGKPFQEVDEDETTEPAPLDTLAEEEEYERQQEQLRREQEEASHMWLKLGVGGALLLATHAVLRRAVAPRDAPSEEEETESVREETPASSRRLTLADEEPTPPATPRFVPQAPQQRVITEEMMKQIPSIVQSAPTPLQVSLDDEEPVEEEEIEEDEVAHSKTASSAPKEELYSDEEMEQEEGDETVPAPKKVEPKQSVAFAAPKREEPGAKEESPEPDEDVEDDVEIIEEEDLEEELEEEEISDVDDAELLNRLEAKYGRLPDPERPGGYKIPKDGGNSIDDWPGEPSDAHWRHELDSAERDLRQGSWEAAVARAASPELASSGRARYIVAKALDELAEAKRDNRLLGRSIAAYLELLKMNEKLSDRKLLETAERTMNRMHFRGTYLNAEPVHRLLIRRFPDDPAFRNNLTITYLMANRADLAAEVLKETLARWPEDRVALAHYAFVLKTQYNRLEEAVDLFQKALDGDTGPANEPRFYFHLGDSLLLLERYAEAHEVHKRATKLGHFLSAAQRSLYNVNRLKSRPWWNIEDTPYVKLARALEKSWKTILREGEAARALYVAEKEGLRERGDWSQLDLYTRGREIPDRCSNAPVTCSIVQKEPLATGCRRGQIKFSSMEPGTHVRPHVGPTNCRLRMHLALSNTEGTYLRVDKETRQWQVGKVLLFDDSFEHEVWHNGSATRLVLIVDLWHPDLTAAERNSLPAI